LNALVFVLAAAALFVLARRGGNAILPMVVLALHPLLVALTGMLLAESLFVALLLWALALQRMKSPVAIAASGVLWALATLTREIALPFFLVSVVLDSSVRSDGTRLRRVAALLVAAYVLTLSPWLVRNAVVLGSPVISATSGFNLWATNQRDLTEAYGWRSDDLGTYYRRYLEFSTHELERDRIALRRGLTFIAEELPHWFYRKAWSGIGHLLEPDNYVMRWGIRYQIYGPLSPGTERLLVAVTTVGELLVLLWGIYALLSPESFARRLEILGMIGAGVAVHVVTLADSRHRLGLEMLLLAMAGCRSKPFSRGRLGFACVICVWLLLVAAASGGANR
jgi:hypothetical protein